MSEFGWIWAVAMRPGWCGPPLRACLNGLVVLFFGNVNQVLVRLWARRRHRTSVSDRRDLRCVGASCVVGSRCLTGKRSWCARSVASVQRCDRQMCSEALRDDRRS